MLLGAKNPPPNHSTLYPFPRPILLVGTVWFSGFQEYPLKRGLGAKIVCTDLILFRLWITNEPIYRTTSPGCTVQYLYCTYHHLYRCRWTRWDGVERVPLSAVHVVCSAAPSLHDRSQLSQRSGVAVYATQGVTMYAAQGSQCTPHRGSQCTLQRDHSVRRTRGHSVRHTRGHSVRRTRGHSVRKLKPCFTGLPSLGRGSLFSISLAWRLFQLSLLVQLFQLSAQLCPLRQLLIHRAEVW